MKNKFIKHIIKNNSREHVLSWVQYVDKNGNVKTQEKCSCPNCEINRNVEEQK
jgi:hypothetical protein